MDCDISIYDGLDINHSLRKSHQIVTQNGINILYFNARSIRNKFEEIELLIGSYKIKIHIIVITETWLDKNEIDFFNLENYNTFHSTREKMGGGVSIYSHRDLDSCLIANEKILTNSHCLIIKVAELQLSVGAVYRWKDDRIIDFTDCFSGFLNKYNNIIFIGDFNINILNTQSNETAYFVNTLSADSYAILNNLSDEFTTRVTDSTATTIDLIVTDVLHLTYNLDIDNLEFSDHKLLTFNMNKTKCKKQEQWYSKIDFNKFCNLAPQCVCRDTARNVHGFN